MGFLLSFASGGAAAHMNSSEGVTSLKSIVELVFVLLTSTGCYALMPGLPWRSSKPAMDRWKRDAYGNWKRIAHRYGIGDGKTSSATIPNVDTWSEDERQLVVVLVDQGEKSVKT